MKDFMKGFQYPFFSIFLFILFAACSEIKKTDEERSANINTRIDAFDSTRSIVSKKLSEIFETDSLLIINQDTIKDTGSLANLYKRNQYQPFWLYEERVEDVLHILKQSSTDGLNPEDYLHSDLDETYKNYLNGGITSEEAMRLEIALSRSIFLYIKHMYNGKVNPVTIFPEWNYKPSASEVISDSMLVCYFKSDLDSLPVILRPHYKIYEVLRNNLKLVDSLGSQGVFMEKIPYVGNTLEYGDTSYTISAIKKRLQSTSEYNFDSIDDSFNKQLRESIKIFQTHVGLTSSGKIDKRTLDKLNFTVEEVRAALLVNMERFRWLPNDLPPEFILINIADYTLRHFKDSNVVYTESVIVGREYTSTPVFEAMMTYIEFNPYWTVPRSIAVKEILPSLKRNPNYLQSHNMDLFNGNTQVSIPNSFNNYTADNFPFTVRENPSPKNSLGQVKLMFPNPYSIYLHDTPGKYLFERDERSFSHGCIRLKDPLKFSLHLLSKQGITQAQIDKIIRNKKNYVISLKEKIPVMITYFTCYSKTGDPRVYFFKDIYGKDKNILQSLNAKIIP